MASLRTQTVLRVLVVGKTYLILAAGLSLMLGLVLFFADRPGFETFFPLEIPVFATMASMGGILVFTSDRAKGVYEYLLAYGQRPTGLFATGLLSVVALVSIVLATSSTFAVGAFLATGNPVPAALLAALVLYSIPMTLASALLGMMAGMLWSSLSSPRTGINGPAGLTPAIGVLPPIIMLFVGGLAPASAFYLITGGASAAIILAVLALLAISGRRVARERFLSPM